MWGVGGSNMAPNEILTLVIAGLSALFAGGTLFYEIVLNRKQKKYIENQNKLNLLNIKNLTPQLSFDKIDQYGPVKNEENYLSYYVGIENKISPEYCSNNVLVSIKNNTPGIAKNIQIEESESHEFSVSIANNKSQDIGGNNEEKVLFKLPGSLYKENQILNFNIAYKDINGKSKRAPIQFRISVPIDGVIHQ